MLLAAGCGGAGGTNEKNPAITPSGNLPPSNVRLVEVSSLAVGQISASWMPASDDKTPSASLRYQLHASTQPNFVPSQATLRYETQGQLSGVITSGLEAGRRYEVRLVGQDDQGASSVSAPLQVMVADTSATPVAGAVVRVLEATEVTEVTTDALTIAVGVPVPAVGTFLASSQGAGYLRKVTGTAARNGVTVVSTERASLAEVLSNFSLSSVVRMPALPSGTATGQAQKPKLSAKAGVEANQQWYWQQSGFRYSAGRVTPIGVQKTGGDTGREATSAPEFEVGPTTTATGGYANLLGPGRIGIAEGASGEARLWAETTTDKKPWFGNQVSICKFEVGAVTNEDPNAKPRELGVDLIAPIVRETVIPFTDGDRTTRASQSFKVTATSGTASSHPYRVTATLYLEDYDRRCTPPRPGEDLHRPLGGWREEVDLEIEIFVGNDAFPSRESAVQSFEGTADVSGSASARFRVTNNAVVTFDPVISYEAKLGDRTKGLEYVRIKLEASPSIEQTLTVAADAKGTIDAEAPLIQPRKFYKLFVAAGGIPIVVSGEFTLMARINGQVTGTLAATEVLKIGFDRVVYGVECSGHMDCVAIEERRPVASLKVGGEGNAAADLTMTLVPRLKMSVYESLNGSITLDPHLTARAAIQGHVKFEAAGDPDAQVIGTASEADYRLKEAALTAGMNAYVYGDFTVLDRTWASWPSGATADNYETHRRLPLVDAVVAKLPELAGRLDMEAIHPADVGAIRVIGTATEWPNPWAGIFPGMPASLITWQRWTTPKVLVPPGVAGGSYRLLAPASDTEGEVWVVFSAPGDYVVRLGGFGSWGTWARQYVEVPVAVRDDNQNGILDHVEARFGAPAIFIGSVTCSAPIVGQQMICTVDGSGLPESIAFFASNCLPSAMSALPGGSMSRRQFGCTPVAVGAPVEVTYEIPGFVGVLPVVPVKNATAPSAVASTTRVSVSSDGKEANSASDAMRISADGRFVIFTSRATNLIEDYPTTWLNHYLYLRDRSTGTTTAIGVGGNTDLGNIQGHAISGNGRFVAFTTFEGLVAEDKNWGPDVYVIDLSIGAAERVNITQYGGDNGDLGIGGVELSADGRFVVFESWKALVPEDTNTHKDVYVRDRLTGELERVSVASDGAEGDSDSTFGPISADGRYVAFSSWARNLVPNDTNSSNDVFVRDRLLRKTIAISIPSDGILTNSVCPAISADGLRVAFLSRRLQYVNGHVFVHDIATGQTVLASIGVDGQLGNNYSGCPSLSADGNTVAFSSYASDLVVDDTNEAQDAFVRMLDIGKTERVSVSSDGAQSGGTYYVGWGAEFDNSPRLSADGRLVAFGSASDRLVSDDTNNTNDIFVRDRGSAHPAPEEPGSHVVFQPGPEKGIDAFVTSVYDSPQTYEGYKHVIRVGGWGDYYYGLIRFDLSGLPPTASQAVIRLYTIDGGADYGSAPMLLDRVTSLWDETVTWASRPTYVTLRQLQPAARNQWYEIDVTSLYNSWKSGTTANHGIQLRPDTSGAPWNVWDQFYSSDYTDDPSLRPQLVVVP
jgi:Tol biopolymer transport system component